MSSTQEKVNKLVENTQRMRRDAERVRLSIDNLRESKPRESLEEIERRLWEIDDVNAEICAMVSFLSTIQMMIFSSEYPPEVFQLARINKNEFLFQVSNLLSYYKTVAFSIQEMSKTTRSIFEHHSQRDLLHLKISG